MPFFMKKFKGKGEIGNRMNSQIDQSLKELFPGEKKDRQFSKNIFFTGIELDKLGDVLPRAAQIDGLPYYLNPGEQRKLDELILPKRRLEWLGGRLAAKFAAHLALRQVNSSFSRPWSHLGIDNLASGQPVLLLKEENFFLPHISISHSHGWAVAMASMEKTCGIDIQLVSSRILRVRERFCAKSEELIIGPDAACLTLLWAAKEAIRKSVGRKIPPGFQKICLRDMISRPDDKWALEFLVSSAWEEDAEKEKFMVEAAFLDKHALAFTVRGGNPISIG